VEKMILAADIGNTNIKFGIFEGDKLLKSVRLSVALSKTSDEYGFNLTNMLFSGNLNAKSFDGAIVASVNPNLNYTIEHMINYYFGIKPLIVGSGIKTGINIKYDNPREVGADRIVSSVGAYYQYGGPVIVIDFGTATTFNAVSEKGEFLGGAISIGLKSSSDNLSFSAAKLPDVELVRPKTAICKTTITNMQSGIINGFVGITEHMIDLFKNEMQGNPKVVATGGLSEIVSSQTQAIDIVDRTLTLKGLNRIYKLNDFCKE
jgi:type III pantothenate kinase